MCHIPERGIAYDFAEQMGRGGRVVRRQQSAKKVGNVSEAFEMMRNTSILSLAFILVVAGSLAVVRAQNKAKHHEEEQERKVKENEVPAAALATLKKHAAGNPIIEFEEEIEHGTKFYEGSWKTPTGKVDTLVTEAGDLVEIEEQVSGDTLPKSVLAAAEKAAGKDAKFFFEKKTLVMYEVKFRKGDRRHEIVLTPDGRQHEHEEEQGNEEADE